VELDLVRTGSHYRVGAMLDKPSGPPTLFIGDGTLTFSTPMRYDHHAVGFATRGRDCVRDREFILG
jgi:hypothetical protein